MKRFNQYLNGDREPTKLPDPIEIKDEATIRLEEANEGFNKFKITLQEESDKLKEIIYNSLIGNGLFIDDTLTEIQRQELKEEMKCEVIELKNPPFERVFFKCDILDHIFNKSEPMMSKDEYILIWSSVLNQNRSLKESFEVYNGDDNHNHIICSSRTYVSLEKARRIFFEDIKEEDKPLNEFNELKFIEYGDEKKIMIEAGKARPYSDFFNEFVPNNTEESKRKHKYTVSLHRAIWTEENLEMFKRFEKARFNKDRTKSSYDGFLTNSPLYDPKDPKLRDRRPFKDASRLDGKRLIQDEGVYPKLFGTYHIQHRIDGKLVAINVWDITEKTLGSIYTFYDPDYSFLSLGHITAVREIEYMK